MFTYTYSSNNLGTMSVAAPYNRATLYNVAHMGPHRYKKSYYLCMTICGPYRGHIVRYGSNGSHRYKKSYFPWITTYKVVPVLGQYCSKIVATGDRA